MNRLFAFALLLLGACATPLPQTPPAGLSAEVGPPPAMRSGTVLRYVAHDGYTGLPQPDFQYRVTGTQGDSATVQAQHGNQTWTERYTRDWNWLEHPMTNLQDFRYSPPYPALLFPLVSGKTWQSYVNATDPASGRVSRVRIDGKVLGWERVKVPAGDFDALKVERYVYAGNAGFFRTEERIREYDWYAPKIGLIVQHSGSSEYTDLSKSCRTGDCTRIRNDWTVKQLASYGTPQ